MDEFDDDGTGEEHPLQAQLQAVASVLSVLMRELVAAEVLEPDEANGILDYAGELLPNDIHPVAHKLIGTMATILALDTDG